ncbi:MAG: Fic family protein [Opitutaceae bacterium]|nr:Fic family protein [Opitutaceae bacterium]
MKEKRRNLSFAAMKRETTGYYHQTVLFGETVRAFIPTPLPPTPPLELDETLCALLDKAALALGRLDGISAVLPDPQFFLYSYVRQEAVLSSQIEGTQSSFSDLICHELHNAPTPRNDDISEVSRYVNAMEYGLGQINAGNPLSLRLLCEVHRRLVGDGRGADKEPGTFRRSQNWIGGTRPGNALFVPPPPDAVIECAGALEKFINNIPPTITRPIIKAALAHVQFETIHPFLDGNGRLGRLLITLLLCAEGILRQPMLYLSLHFKRHRDDYYRLLQNVRVQGEWEEWLRFFLEGVVETAETAARTAQKLLQVFEKDRALLAGANNTVRRMFGELQKRPAITAAAAGKKLVVSNPTARKAIAALETLGILREITGGTYRRVYVYDAYLDAVNTPQ